MSCGTLGLPIAVGAHASLLALVPKVGDILTVGRLAVDEPLANWVRSGRKQP